MKKIFTLVAISAIAFSVSSAPISPEAAMQRVSTNGPAKVRAMSSYSLVKTVKTSNDRNAAYIFTPAAGKGFMILSANDAIEPVIGYSDSGNIDVNNLPPALMFWLNKTAERAEYLDMQGLEATTLYAPAEMTAIAPLVATKWNQDAPYNNLCPSINGVTAPTGCVATSMAQAMNYFKYPDVGQGSITYTFNPSQPAVSMNFARTRFDWDNMLDVYTSGNYDDTQAKAVATLMKAAGYSVKMGYGRDVSGALSTNICNALTTYFGYDKGIWYTERNFYSTEEWANMIYDNLKNCGPVIYDGTALDGGHSFLCDGYDGNGYFHFNWGWGGSSDGYYTLDSLRPEVQGIGGAGEGGFNYDQGAVLGMQKPVENPAVHYDRLKIYGSVKAQKQNGNIVFSAVDGEYKHGMLLTGWGNAAYRPMSVNVGIIIEKDDAAATKVAEVQGYFKDSSNGATLTVANPAVGSLYLESVKLYAELPALANGRYKVYCATKQTTINDAPWLPMLATWGNVNYCYLEVENGNVTVVDATQPTITVDTCALTAPLIVRRATFMACEFRNDTDTQISLCYYPMLSRNGVVQYIGDYMLVTVDPHSTVEKTARINFEEKGNDTGVGTYTLSLFNTTSGKVIGNYGEYEMKTISGSLKVSLEKFEVSDAELGTVTIGTRTFDNVYMVKNASDTEVLLQYFVESGYLDTYVKMIFSEYNPETGKFVNDDEPIYNQIPYLLGGSHGEAIAKIDLSDRNHNTIYRINAGYLSNGKTQGLGSLYVGFDLSGVEEVGIGVEEIVEYYNLQGIRLENPQPGQLMIRKSNNRAPMLIIFE